MKLPKAYEANKYEGDIYDLWESSGVFKADPKSPKPHFSMVMPPPNETGTLHVGHALFLTLQDIIARHERQKGKDVLWLPGTDHAALATNAIIEKRLAEQGIDKHQLGREEFIKQVKEFVGNSRETIKSQIRAMGASCDWSRGRYTLDDALNRCVNEVFVKMYKDGLIYRGHRIVNWDPKLGTTVSDDEVDYKEETAPFYTLQYGPFQIGTARPETKFGDKYVVMHPDDNRYANYKHGETFEAEWINGPVNATVIKDESVDPEFGTGVMTITPWHDHMDFEIAERHGLEKEQIIDPEGKLLPVAGEFAGMSIAEARPKIVDKLRSKGLLINEQDYSHNIAINSRGGGIIEPQIKLQWFVDVNRPAVEWKGQLRSLKEVMRAVVEDGDIKIIPKRFEKTYYHWIDNLRDWCISRQIWWGHQIPVWYKGTGEKPETFVGTNPPEGQGWEQDPDTLDTWFSSALWTWSTMVDQELAKDYSLSLNELLKRSEDFKTYHPTNIMETGWDILFFWVARMILATTYTLRSEGLDEKESLPFKTVYLNGLVRTEEGKKMSKSNPDSIIDPIEVISEFGTDALRLGLIAGTSAGADSRVGKTKIIANRNFCNKLWNIARYVQETGVENASEPSAKTIADHWILNKLSIAISSTSKSLDNFKFSEAYDTLYHFVWNDLADWYIEASKTNPNREVLSYVLAQALKLAHPFAPFVTETIWQNLELGGLLAKQSGPEPVSFDAQKAAEFEELKTIVSEARRVSTAAGISNPTLAQQGSSVIENNEDLIKRLGRLSNITFGNQGIRLIGSNSQVWLVTDHGTAKKYTNKLRSSLDEQEKLIKMLEGRLTNKSYLENAPEELVEQTKTELEAAKQKLQAIEQEIKGL